MDEIETRMREVLLALALTSNGRTSAFDSSGGGTPDYVLVDDKGRGKLARGDAPELYYRSEWEAALDRTAREQVLAAAQKELDHIRHSHADRDAGESREDRDRRIVKDGRGISAREVALSVRCGVKDVWNARRAAGVDTEFGLESRNGRSMRNRDEEIKRLTSNGMNAAQVAQALQLSASTVRRALGLKR